MYWNLGDDESADGRGQEAPDQRRRSPATLPRRQQRTPSESPDSKRGDGIDLPSLDADD